MPDLFFSLLPLACIAAACVLLMILTLIDLKHFLLPDKYVFPFGTLGLVFHATTGFTLISQEDVALGCLVGGGVLLLVRAGGNYYYKQESMGLGDVKLLAAAGLWLGPVSVTLALTLGAAAGLVHGLLVAARNAIVTKQKFTISRLVIPAGPGFIVGIVGMMIYDFGSALQTIIATLVP